MLAEGKVTASELLALCLGRITATRETLNAFRCVRAEQAAAEAIEADRRLGEGERAPLLGVPVAIKDDIDLAGEATMFGCRGAFPVKDHDSEAVRRLRAAGAVIVGKTTTPEFGQWPFTEGEAFGATRNPWNPDFSPGGSSGGTASAVAGGLVPGGLGSDGAGSVRIPAAWTHLVGIKPQRGRIPSDPGHEAFHGLTTTGTIARTVADAALLLDVVAGDIPGAQRRGAAAEPFTASAGRDPRRLRIALSLKIPFSIAPASLDPAVASIVEGMGERLAGLGHVVERADPIYGAVGVSFVPRSTAGVNEWESRVPDPALLDPRTRANAATGRRMGGALLRAATSLEAPLRWQTGRIFRRFDVLLTPTTARAATAVGAYDGLSNWETDKLMIAHCPYTWPWNVLGWPAVNVPAGFTASGLPVGAQLVGPDNSERLLISLAAQLEDELRWQDRRPPRGW